MKNIIIYLFLLLPFAIFSQCFKSFSAIGGTKLIINDAGALWGYGYNDVGQLGLGHTEFVASLQRIGNDTDWQQVFYTNGASSFAIKRNGTLWGWGNNQHSNLGFVGDNKSVIPIQIGIDIDWVYVDSGPYDTIAIKKDGSLWGWGSNIYGELNQPFNVNSITPIKISEATNWKKVVLGQGNTLALKTDGTLWACGNNDVGQLGIGADRVTSGQDHNGITTFTQIGKDTNWVDVVTSGQISMGMKSDGTIWGWGSKYGGAISYFPADFPNLAYVPTQIGKSNDWKSVCFDAYGVGVKGIKTNGEFWGINSQTGEIKLNDRTDWKTLSTGIFLLDNNNYLYTFDSSSSTLQNISCSKLAVDEIKNTPDFSVYPNPAKGKVNVEMRNNAEIDALALFSINGSLIFENYNSNTIDVSILPVGIYFLKIKTNQGVFNEKIVKE